ncbi:MAG: hypothetical protein RJB66_2002 [Pseudomonadota bacterium]|jgi:hypothetical protein
MKLLGVDFREVIDTLIRFFKNPVLVMKQMPEWDWKTLIILQLLISLLSGVISSLINLNIWQILKGLILMPPLFLMTAGVSSLFLYYAFLFLTQQNLPPKDIFTLVILSNIPFFIFQTFSSFFPPITLLGFLFTALLLVVGLVERFSLPRALVMKVVGSIWLVFLLIWIYDQIETYQLGRRF